MTLDLLAPARRFHLPDPTLPQPHRVPSVIIERGACATSPDPTVFDVDDRAVNPISAERAQSMCDLCPVRRACLDYALGNEPYGFWGGLDAFERLGIRGGPLPDPDERQAAHLLRVRLISGTPATTIAAEYGVSVRTVERWKRLAGIRLIAIPGGPAGGIREHAPLTPANLTEAA